MREHAPPQAWTLARLERHRAGYLASARAILRCAALAEDVVQDVLLRLAAEPPPVPTVAQAAYAGRMVRNLALDRARRRSFERRHFTDLDGAARGASDGATPEAQVAARDALQRVEAALADLPEPVRTVFRLHRFEGVPQKAVAARMGVSRALVCGLVRRGHLHCLAALDGSCVGACLRTGAAPLAAQPGEEEGRPERVCGELGHDPAGEHAVVAVEAR
ncbi:RNA polymerase sigma-70 factor (ECF subfamily) [Methylobacterium gregans]|nr:RNA polymerase sigma-70 factor (ECF subfamily) [Methylobacterium gregans]